MRQRFDVTGNLKKFSKILGTKQSQRLVHAQLCLDVCSVVPVLLQPCIAIAFLDAMLSWAPPPFDFAFWACWIPFGRAAAPGSPEHCAVLCVQLHWHCMHWGLVFGLVGFGEGPFCWEGNVLRHGALSFGVQSTIRRGH